MIKYFFINVVLMLLICACVSAQNTERSKELLRQLERELFPIDNSKIALYKYIGSTPQQYKVDSSLLIRAQQPDPDVVLDILEQLMHTKDATSISGIMLMYDRHIDFFMQEWSNVYKLNYYAPDKVIKQYTILAGFEVVIKSLSICNDNLNPSDIYEKYVSDVLLYEDYFYNIYKRCEIIKRWKDSSPIFRSLNPCRLFYGNIQFNHLDPFIDELKPFFLNSLEACNFNECSQRDMSTDCVVFIQNVGYFNSFSNARVANFYITAYSSLKKCHRHTMAFRYAGLHQFEDLTRFLVQRYIEDYDPKEYYGYMRDLVADDVFNLRIIIEEGIKHYKEDPEMAQILMSKLPRGRTLGIMQSMDDRVVDVDQGLRILSRSVDD